MIHDADHLTKNIAGFDFNFTRPEVGELTKPSLLRSGTAILSGVVDEIR